MLSKLQHCCLCKLDARSIPSSPDPYFCATSGKQTVLVKSTCNIAPSMRPVLWWELRSYPLCCFFSTGCAKSLIKLFFPCSSRHILRRSNTAIMQKVQTVFHSWALTQQCCSFQISTQFEMRIIIASTGAQAQVRRSVFQIGGAPIRGRKLLGVGGGAPGKNFRAMASFLLATSLCEC